MKTLFAHIQQKPEHIHSEFVVCAQRPLPGEDMWEGNSVGNGVYYASGSLSEYEKVWSSLDASLVEYLTNEDIERIIRDRLLEKGIPFERAKKIGLDQTCDLLRIPRMIV